MATAEFNPRFLGRRPPQPEDTPTTAPAIGNSQDGAGDTQNIIGASRDSVEAGALDLSLQRDGTFVNTGRPSTPIQATPLTRKRLAPTEAAKFAEEEGKKAKLSPANMARAKAFSRLGEDEQRIQTQVAILQLGQVIGEIQPAEAVYTVPHHLSEWLVKTATDVLLEPELSHYVSEDDPKNEPTVAVIKKLHDSGKFNINTIKDDDSKMSAIKNRLRKKFNDRRHNIKSLIAASTGMKLVDPAKSDSEMLPKKDIIALAKEINKLRGKNSTKEPTIQMLVRIAFLRYCYREHECLAKGDFWPYVDNALKQIRETNNNDKVLISSVFKDFFDEDLQRYGNIDVQTYSTETEVFA